MPFGQRAFDNYPQNTPKPVGPDAEAAWRETQGQILYLQLLAQSNGIVTEVSAPITGDVIALQKGRYLEVYNNKTNNPIRVQVFADIISPGAGIVLSTSASQGDGDKVDQLVLTANGHTESISVILMGNSRLYGRDFDNANFPLALQDAVRIRIFDPARLLSYVKMFPPR